MGVGVCDTFVGLSVAQRQTIGIKYLSYNFLFTFEIRIINIFTFHQQDI